ncbi:MAG TPA: flagellar motor protein MotB [Arenimonas sp.]|nr:flagellar motor protein MotB [Arenimonas sp.]
MADTERPIIIKKKKVVAGGHHGGAWKVAYADFVTAMMAFFLVMWLVATMPQEQLGGISEFFKNPSAVRGRSAEMAASALGEGGGGDAPVQIFEHRKSQPIAGDPSSRAAAEAELDPDAAKRLAAEQDKRKLEELKQLLEEAIAKSIAMAPFKDQLLIDITPEGLRIQIVDSQNRPMFDLGSSQLKDYSLAILVELANYIGLVPNRIAISGHTDDTPFAGRSGLSNWELSADRANAARRALLRGGLAEDKVARVVGLASSVLFDKTDPRGAVNRRISIVVLNEAAERAARELDAPQAEAAGDADAAAMAGEDAAAADEAAAGADRPAD